ncbi:BRCA2, oligonucleotide/oligosaccharide-binding, domain 1-domain-containing protein [Blakeslea trispora]|nr:BRCA2, oligonucleotide/oligosaccharide-binding, domain 1-domain-containing protein [Blakeslea trispora]
MSSSCDSDDNDYEWDDITPSLQDQIFDELDSQDTENEQGLSLDLPDSRAAFDVFLDQLLQIPFKNKPIDQEKKIPLSEIPVNQQHHRASTTDEKSKSQRVLDSQEDPAIWGDIDADLLSDIELNAQRQKDITNASPPLFSGFSTASGKTLKPPSKEALQKAMDSLRDEHPKLENDPHPQIESLSAMKGFQTASGKALKPTSEASRKKALRLFEDMDEQEKPSPQLTGFRTASNKPLKEPSEESKLNAAKMLQDLEEDQPKGIKRPAEQPLSTVDKYENVLQQFGGFRKGHSEQAFNVSEQSKKRALGLFETDSVVPTNDQQAQYSVTSSPKSQTNTPDISSPVSTKSPSPPVQQKTPSILKRNKRIPAIQKQNKPFKSPIIRSNIELTKAAVNNNRNTVRARGNAVFDLTIPKDRYTLSSLGLPLQYTKNQLLAKQIPISVIHMTVQSAKKYVFEENWGPREAERDMIQKGCLPHRLSSEWIQNHYALIVWKLACLIRSYPDQLKDDWHKQKVLDQLLYRYEREMNLGHRPVLKKILEQDDISVKHMILFISDIVEIKSAMHYNTSSKYMLYLSDGWYQVPACIDVRMEHAIALKKLRIGHKLSICGAQIAGDKAAQSPLTIHNNSTFLLITVNSTLPAPWDAKLGYHRRKLMIRSIPTIYEDGGMVTALDIVVCRKFPMLFTENLSNGLTVTRTRREEEDLRRTIQYGHASGQEGLADMPNFRAYQRSKHGLGRLNETTRSPSGLMDERRVSSYFRVRICDTRSKSNEPWATLVLSNANEVHHLDITEGSRYRVFFMVPYRPKNKKYPGLDLKTTRSTRWEPVSLGQTKPAGYIARFVCACKDICQQDITSDFDLVVFVLYASTASLEHINGRKLWHQTLLVSDQSQHICRIEFRLPLNSFPDLKGQVMGLMNVRYMMHDTAFDITCLKASDETEVITKLSTAPEHMQKGIHQLREWTNSHPDQISSLSDRVHDITQ